MKKKSLLIAVVIIIILIVVGIFAFGGNNTGPRVISFEVERPDLGEPNFVATAFQLSKIDVMGIDASATSSGKTIVLGPMELVESNAAGDQTWIYQVPQNQMELSEVYAQGYLEGGKKARKFKLAVKGKEKIAAILWPGPVQANLTGTVKDVLAKKLTMGVSQPVNAAVTVNFAQGMRVVDSAGKVTPLSKIRAGSVITVTGSYTDENTFSASEIEIRKP